jgi:Subtilase family
LLATLGAIKARISEEVQGAYLDITGRAGEPMALDSLNASGLELLKFTPARLPGQSDEATVFATNQGLQTLEKKISDFETRNRVKDDGTAGGPFNAKLVQGIDAITEAAIRSLWRSNPARFPELNAVAQWEVWLWPESEASFRQLAQQSNIHLSLESLKFPEDTVVVATCTQAQLAQIVSGRGQVKSLAVLATLPSFFDDLPPEDQSDWLNSLIERTEFNAAQNPVYVTLLDTGVSRAHPLIQPVLDGADRCAARLEWSVEDNIGHGTKMAGLATYGDLTIPLQTGLPISVSHRLESAKIFPDAGQNEHDLLGARTEKAVQTAEIEGVRRRVFSLCSTTGEDTPHDGAPTSWSSALDKIGFGSTEWGGSGRLVTVSAGNTAQNKFQSMNYLGICDAPVHELESPAQAWNAIAVGAFTEKATLIEPMDGAPYAPVGDLSPSSRTSSWNSIWPLKPDIVLEGGNWWHSGPFPPMKHSDLELLTTHHQSPQRSFCTAGQTSAATALSSRQLAIIWGEYPEFWPETVRGLYVLSARWTPQMLSHLPAKPNKGDYGLLFKRYGYGVPDVERARKSAANSLALVVQDSIVPYARSTKPNAKNIVNNELKLFELPWPAQALRELGNTNVTLRVALSSFILPNPAEASRGKKYLYASHNLRFTLNRPDENAQQFLSRISRETEDEEDSQVVDDSSDGWTYGVNRRNVGSLHIDELTCKASDMARRNLIAVHPVAGWWKSPKVIGENPPSVRFSLVVEINAEQVEIDLYTEVATAIAAAVVV